MPKLTASYKLNEEQLNQLKQIVPEAFKDNILDFNSLYEALSDFLEDDENTDFEQFGLSWPGKRQAKRAAAIPPIGTLVPVLGDGVDEETTKNIYIEGDNLEVLKILKKAYTGRIKMIYIDPPYNTGNDFIYPDDFSETVESFQRRTGQLNENNEKMTTNNRSDGRFHSKWCSMIYPRLLLARELLSEDGVIFISIDDNEVAQLRKICDEIFGEENFLAQVIHKNNSMKNQSKLMGITTEYIVVFIKNKIALKDVTWRIKKKGASDIHAKYIQMKEQGFALEKISDEIKEMYNRPKYSHLSRWNKVDNKGVFMDSDLSREGGPKDFTIINPNTNSDCLIPNRGWGKSKEELKRLQDSDLIWYGDGSNPPRMKSYLAEENLSVPDNFWYFDNSIDTRWIKDEFEKLVFENPKPLEMIEQALSLHTSKNDIILDFFSGSATTAHAVMKLNANDKESRQFILIQLAEICNEKSDTFKTGFKNICEIGKERIRRAGKKIKEEAGLNAANLDTGFKVYHLAPSNYKAWENYAGTDVKQLEELFKADSLMQGWKEDDLLTEVMLLEGFPLDSKIELLSQFKKNKIKKISSDFRDNTLYICLDKDIVKETIEALKLTDKERFICLDLAIDDQSKIRLEDKNLIKTL